MRIHRNKLNGEKLVTQHVVERCVKVVFIKVMEKRLTTSDTTGQAAYATYQLLWSVATRIAYDNPNALEIVKRHFKL